MMMPVEPEPEDLKWSDYLQGAISMFSSNPDESREEFYVDLKAESPFDVSGLSSWHHSQHQQHLLQSADAYDKDFQRISPAFGQM